MLLYCQIDFTKKRQGNLNLNPYNSIYLDVFENVVINM